MWFIGLMSGTSLDGIDGVLARFEGTTPPVLSAHAHLAMPAMLRAELLALNRAGDNELHRAALAANALMGCHADVVAQLLRSSGRGAGDIAAVGVHGQTVRHRPGDFDGTGYTLQLVNGALLAERCGIDVICDFRSRDVAAGGQGAPLVPAFHAAQFAQRGRAVAVLNLGGIANLSLLHANGAVSGFDCGPASVLMDLWCQRERGSAFDADGAWAAGGQVDTALLAQMLTDPFFDRAPPKSTGRDLFNAAWLAALPGAGQVDPQDVMATLAEMSARGVSDALQRHAPRTSELVVCGGGALNTHLMGRIAALLGPAVRVRSCADSGIAPEHVEALAFAWLAHAFVERRPGNVPEVTAARGPRVLGALYPAR